MTSEVDPQPTLQQVIDSWLPAIDARLRGVRIPDRCLPAAQLFMECAVVEVNGEDKADFFGKSWFKPVYQAILTWYREHYGEALNRPPSHVIGACEFSGTIFELQVPRTLSKVETEGETAWLIFPNELLDGESASDWIVRPPNLALLADDERQSFLKQVEVVGCQLRNIFINLMESDDDRTTNELIKMVPSHLTNAASHLFEHPAHNLSLACWEAHQAVEKVLKVLARQQSSHHRFSHSLKRLRDDLIETGLALPDDAGLSRMPNENQLIAMRAGEAQTNLEQSYDIYRTCLEMTDVCTKGVKRKFHFHNFRLLLRKPVFI